MTAVRADAALVDGALVEARGSRWIVSAVTPGGSTLVELQSVEDGHYDRTLRVIWEVEPGARVLPASSLPEVTGFDPPQRLAAFLDAMRWGAVTSADVNALQSPFRSGVAIEDYQLEPVSRALTAPRVNLLLADDVGLGKTIEAGLVLQELLLRHRATRVMIVSPAGLVLKWKAETAEKFGLDFHIIDSRACAELRRTHGSAANPFRVHPLTIVSLPWLRSARAQRLLDEVLPPDPTAAQPVFDLLILDEAHHVAPAAPKQRYAVDSQQTKLMRRLAPHFEHRLFLSATPHNGYPESFTALLELIDNTRFARALAADEQARRDVVIRRLKKDIVDADGKPRFLPRYTLPIEVDYPDSEREVHALLTDFAQRRAQRLTTSRRGRRAADLVTLLLKKRLFSSPLAFGRTVSAYMETVGAHTPDDDTVPPWLDTFWQDVADLTDEDLRAEEDTAVRRARVLQAPPSEEEIALLRRMRDWAAHHSANPDAKATQLIAYLRSVCVPGGRDWTNERVVVFTEYRDTQEWLHKLLNQEGLGGQRVALLHGGLSTEDREELRTAFQTDPTEHPVRILLATDAASEGIDLHWHCHRLVTYDIPFNPNKLEQRIGRIDRYGQQHPPEVRHFVGANWQTTRNAFEADLEFLARVAQKVARMEEDLGAINAVLADAVQRRMLGQNVDVDAALRAKSKQQRRGRLPSDADVSTQTRRLRQQLDASVAALQLNPFAMRRVVDTALQLARQQPLIEANDPDAPEVFDVPTLTGSWVRASAGLPHPMRAQDIRPVTFDPEIARRRREDVVFAHLNHPLVAMSTELLRAAVTNSDSGLHRVTAIVSDDPQLATTLVVSYARLVIVGGDGVRLHEEVLHAGGWLRTRFARVESFALLDTLLSDALAAGEEAPPHIQQRLASAWPAARDPLFASLKRRAGDRQQSLEARLRDRHTDERDRIVANLDRFAKELHRAIADAEDSGSEFVQLTLELDETERQQAQRDLVAWRRRLDALSTERDAQLERLARRYSEPKAHLFPVAVAFVIPRREVIA